MCQTKLHHSFVTHSEKLAKIKIVVSFVCAAFDIYSVFIQFCGDGLFY